MLKKHGIRSIKLPYLKCKRCGYNWIPRRPQEPKVCPKCKSPYWNKNRILATHRESWYIKKEVNRNEGKKSNKGKEAGD